MKGYQYLQVITAFESKNYTAGKTKVTTTVFIGNNVEASSSP